MRKTALITGASGGLGECFARLWAAEKYKLILVARSKDALQQLGKELEKKHGIDVMIIVEDLSNPSAPAKILKKIGKERVDVLVNNAGFGDFGIFACSDPARDAAMIRLNVESLTHLTRLVLPGMLTRKSGRILNVASTAAFQPGPLMAVYYATKAYVLSFSLALSQETRGTGVTVTCLCPGPTKTGFERHANLGRSKLFKRGTMNPYVVARIGFRACMAGRPLVTAGFTNKLGAFLTRLVPRMWAARAAYRAQSPIRR
jgi:uncharacterized protein